jgi:hypothetical protein
MFSKHPLHERNNLSSSFLLQQNNIEQQYIYNEKKREGYMR